MKKLLKTLLVIMFVILINCTFIDNVSALSASIKVSSNSSTVVLGGTVTTYVTVSSSSPIGAWEYTISYDSSDLTLKSGTSHVAAYADSGSKYSVTYTYTFTAKATGSTSITVKNYSVVGWDESTLSTSVSSSSVNVITQAELEASYSTNNNLSSLSIEGIDLNEEFDSSVTEYTADLEALTESINVLAEVSDSKSSISGIGEISVSEGTNKIEISVTAQNGSIKIYTITAVVHEQNPIYVLIDDIEYTVVRNVESLTKPSTYLETSVFYEDEEVTGFYSEITDFLLVGLKDSDGNIYLYIYDEETGEYTLYNEINCVGVSIYLIDFPEDVDLPSNYELYTTVIGVAELEVYKLSGESNYSLVYGLNVATGIENIYVYDKVEETLQIYNSDEINDLLLDVSLYKFCSIIFAFISLLLIGLVLSILFKSKKKTVKKEVEPKKQKEKTKETIIEKKPEKEKKQVDKKINNKNKSKDFDF